MLRRQPLRRNPFRFCKNTDIPPQSRIPHVLPFARPKRMFARNSKRQRARRCYLQQRGRVLTPRPYDLLIPPFVRQHPIPNLDRFNPAFSNIRQNRRSRRETREPANKKSYFPVLFDNFFADFTVEFFDILHLSHVRKQHVQTVQTKRFVLALQHGRKASRFGGKVANAAPRKQADAIQL